MKTDSTVLANPASKKIITIDAGNTHTVFGLWYDENLTSTCRLSTRSEATDWEWKTLLMSWLDGQTVIDAAVISSVVPAIEMPLKNCFANFFGCHDVFSIHHTLPLPFTFDYPGRATLGGDRIANAAGGVKKYGQNLIIIDFGTAITYCLILEGQYKGGLIAPGIHTSLSALFRKTSKLPAVEFIAPSEVPGKDTISSIQAGAWYTWKGAVRETLAEMKKAAGREVLVVATGGIAGSLPFAVEFFDVIDPNLTLRGLLEIYKLRQIK